MILKYAVVKRGLLLWILTGVVSITLPIYMSDALAVPVVGTSKELKQYHTYIKEKAPNDAGDVWERIRLGMKIPRPSSERVLPKQTLISEKNQFNKPYTLRPASHTSIDAMTPENTQTEQPIRSKYLSQPHTAIAPMNNYTALGLKLRFGSNPPPAADNHCIPSLTTTTQQQQTNANPDPRGFHSQLPKRAVFTHPAHGILQAEPETDPSIQTTHKLSPCIKRPGQKVAGLNNQNMQQEPSEQSNTKKSIIDERINKQLAFFRQSPGYLYQVAERARPYLYHIVEGLSKHQLPLELALLPIVESGYQPTALSPKGAAGLWQFIPSTGKDYDLKQSNRYDERLDILASTQAAIRFLTDLKDHFSGDWLLALAAYNCGQGAVDDAISRNLSEGLDTDYWSLHLPEETQDYVPRLLALSDIFANPEIYGLKLAPIKNEPYFVKVTIDREADIKHLADKNFAVLAKLVNLSHEQFSRLNPGYLKSTLTAEASYTFLLPLANANQLHRLLISIAQFMAVPASQTINDSSSQFKALPCAWDPYPSSIRDIQCSTPSNEIF